MDEPDGILDPAERLSPTARRLVGAARRLLARGGYEALTVEAVAADAGAYRDAVRYYFGGKAAFIAAVVDSLAHDQMLNAAAETERLPAGEQRVHSLVAHDRKLLDDRDSFRDFFALLPHVLADDELRERVAGLYTWYRDVYAQLMDGEAAQQRAAAPVRLAHGGHDRRAGRAGAAGPRRRRRRRAAHPVGADAAPGACRRPRLSAAASAALSFTSYSWWCSVASCVTGA